MPEWLGSGIVLAAVALLVGVIVFRMIRAKKQGKSTCGCGCEHCALQCRRDPRDPNRPQ